jgi:sarcosine oxidase
MRVVVVGAGVMGLSAARVLAERGHSVVALERFGVANGLASSSGATRIWRIAHPDRPRVRLARWNQTLWCDLERRTGRTLLLQRGVVWRGGEASLVAEALAAEGVDHQWLDEAGQLERFPELAWQPGRPVIWQPEAGTLLASDALAVSAELFALAGGELVTGVEVRQLIQRSSGGVRVATTSGTYDADAAVVTVGPWASTLLATLGIDVPVHPVLEQITYVSGGDGPWQDRPCLIDVPDEGGSFGLYALPTPGIGYKVGIDVPLCDLDLSSSDRTPDRERETATVERVRREIPGLDATPIRSEVCSWTSSPDDQFILDRVGDVVFGCGDSGQGFKFLPMLGEVLSDLVEGTPPHPDARGFGLVRFGQATSGSGGAGG